MSEIFNIVDVPAYRHENGAFSLFCVFKASAPVFPLGLHRLGVISLDGVETDPATVREFYTLSFSYDTDNPNTAKLIFVSTEEAGIAETVTISDDLNDYDSHLIQVDVDSSGNVSMYSDGSPLTVIGGPVTLRKLNGLGNIGAEILTSGLLGNYFNGNIGEIAFFGRKLSDLEREQATAYLKNKWGI